jgi:hypothetical protein
MQLTQVLLEGPPRKFNPNHDLPDPFQVRFDVDKSPQGLALGRFTATLEHVNFKEQDRIPITVKLIFNAREDTLSKKDAQYAAQLAAYTAAKSRAQHEAYVKTVRERVKAAVEVKIRAFEDLREEERHVIYRRLLDALTTGTQASQPDQVHLTSELLRRLFDVDAMLYFIAPDWWRPKTLHYYAETPPGGSGSINDPFQLQESEKVGWEPVNANRPPNYLVTEESRPAPLGASLGWQLELDGDNLRNAFLNAAWVKAVLPVRFRREKDTLQWLKDHVEGMDGLDAIYQDGPADWNGKTIGEVLNLLAEQIDKLHDKGNEVDQNNSAQPAEIVFQNGFDPLQGGVRVDAKAYDIFDQWLEVLPTDQVVAQEYHG